MGRSQVSAETVAQSAKRDYRQGEHFCLVKQRSFQQITQIDNDLKTKALNYNNLKNQLASLDRKSAGSLITKDLADIVKADDFVQNSEYLQTVVVIVPK